MRAHTAVALLVALVARRTDNNVIDAPADTLGGTWSVKGNVVSFAATNGSQFVGTVGGISILIEGDGLAFRYIK